MSANGRRRGQKKERKKKKTEARKKVGDFVGLLFQCFLSASLARARTTHSAGEARRLRLPSVRWREQKTRPRRWPAERKKRKASALASEWNFLPLSPLLCEPSLQLLSARRGKGEPSEHSCGEKETEKRRGEPRREKPPLPNEATRKRRKVREKEREKRERDSDRFLRPRPRTNRTHSPPSLSLSISRPSLRSPPLSWVVL